MKIDGARDEAALQLLGATRIEEIRNEASELIGHHVDPDVDMSGYDTAVAQVAQHKSDKRWAELRARRTELLVECDWTQMADTPLSSTERKAWGVYRQKLRDVTEGLDDPDSAQWPALPV